MVKYGLLYPNTNTKDINPNIAEDKYIYKVDGKTIGTLSYLMGYNPETLRYDGDWNKIINTLNHDVFKEAGTRKIGMYKYSNGKAATVDISIKDLGDKVANEFVDERGNVTCPSTIGVVFPKNNYKIEEGMNLGNYNESQNKYEVQVIFPNSNEYKHTDFHHNLVEKDNNGNLTYYKECYDKGNSDWETCTYVDEDYDIGTEYYALLFDNNWSESIKYTTDSANNAQENLEMTVKTCNGVSLGENFALGTDSYYVSDGSTGNHNSTCYYKVYDASGNSMYKEFTWRANVNSSGIITDNSYNICKFDAGAIDFNNCMTGLSGYYYNSSIKPSIGEMLITKTNLNNHVCTNFYEINQNSYSSADTEKLCKNSNKAKAYYYCACEYVSNCKTGIGNSTKNIWDCSKCNWIDPCVQHIQEGYEGNYYCGIFGEETWSFIKNIYTVIRILVPVLIIFLGIIDFLKVVFTGEDKDLKTSGKRFLKRIIAGVVFLLLPILLQFVMNLAGFSEDCLAQLTRITQNFMK